MEALPADRASPSRHGRVADGVSRLLAEQAASLRRLDPGLETLAAHLRAAPGGPAGPLRGGLVGVGARTAGAPGSSDALWLAVAVEMLHRHALVHDELWRRAPGGQGLATSMARDHRDAGFVGDLPWQGVSGAILVGDLLLVGMSAALERLRAPPAAARRVRRLVGRLRSDLLAGQILDLRARFHPRSPVRTAARTALLKAGRYTVGRPLQLGAVVAGAPRPALAALGRFGAAAGMLMQLRHDLCRACDHPAGDVLADDLRVARVNVVAADARRAGGFDPLRARRAIVALHDRVVASARELGPAAPALVALIDPGGPLASAGGPACGHGPCREAPSRVVVASAARGS